MAAVAGALLLLPIAACSESEQPATEPANPVASSEATPEQLASVIAAHESTWREAIAAQQDCKSAQGYAALADATPTEKAAAEDCLQSLIAAGQEAGTATSELRALEAPQSMQVLVDDTVKYLDQIADADLETICGGEPYGAACVTEDTAFVLAYKRLEQQLDAWGPYL